MNFIQYYSMQRGIPFDYISWHTSKRAVGQSMASDDEAIYSVLVYCATMDTLLKTDSRAALEYHIHMISQGEFLRVYI